MALGVVLAGLVVGTGPWVWTRAASSGHVFRAADAPSAPVALVLGAGLNPDGTPSPYLAGRLDVAAALVDSGRARAVLASGDNRYSTDDEPTAMQDYLVVSQGYHLPRAVAICRAVGLDADGVGDWTGERYRDVWRRGTVREVPASVKAVLDVVTGRDPVLGTAETGVRDALAAP